jgi:hypothetical protein
MLLITAKVLDRGVVSLHAALVGARHVESRDDAL